MTLKESVFFAFATDAINYFGARRKLGDELVDNVDVVLQVGIKTDGGIAMILGVKKTGKKGVMISAVDLLKGIAVGAEMKVIEVEGADGTLHTNYEGKAQAAVDALLKDDYDFAYIHVEAPDEMGHQGSLERKLKAIEFLDERVIKVVKEQMDASGVEYRMLVTPDHPTPIAIRTHSSDPIPFLLYDSTRQRRRIGFYNEKEAMESGIVVEDGYEMIEKLLED